MKSKTKVKRRATATTRTASAADWAVINTSLEQYLDLASTEANQNTLQRTAGQDNFLKIQEIISFVSNQNDWVSAHTLSSAADLVAAKLSRHYPLLSPKACFLLLNQATYGWR